MQEDVFPICTACGSQYDAENGSPPKRCKICDDPRQFVPPSGQSWTTLSQLRTEHENKWAQDPEDSRVWYFWTEPKFAIGQRAFLLRTPHGNIIWDLLPLLSPTTISKLNDLGGVHAIIISHPHYYATYASWLAAFPDATLYVSSDDKGWLCRQPERNMVVCSVIGRVGYKEEVVDGVWVVKVGGHFEGSLVLLLEGSGKEGEGGEGASCQTTYSFMWSIPNMIPLPPKSIKQIWDALKDLDFESTHGAFVGMDVRGEVGEVKERLLESMKIQVRGEGWDAEETFAEKEQVSDDVLYRTITR
ncbi:uncharacterized protein KY384_008975 [Bacidia gigantensis]|uniref:uncharacterized protein n=1 Tax=Bacidia gigantensis TaxID=2732470 RepID=UPI001D04DBAD|nr:uncharacterized protein KY384_008975 [Bacidia gigantensis]KAG8525331.1 hypothetical protein KY384_008975 [Bacidia gigantensis]